MSSSFVSFFSGGYLYAIAHFGVLYVVPKISLKCKLSTFTTAPSIPNDSFSLSSPIFLIASIASSIVLHSFLTGTTLNPRFSSLFNSTKCEFSESNVFASYFCTLNPFCLFHKTDFFLIIVAHKIGETSTLREAAFLWKTKSQKVMRWKSWRRLSSISVT